MAASPALLSPSTSGPWAWGYNSAGELGNGTTTSATSPVPVSGLTGVTSIAGGTAHSLAIKSDGTVWTWGDNSIGQLGATSANTCGTAPYTNPCSLTPLQVTNFTGGIAVGGGENHSVALKSDGTVWAWGDNSIGQLGAPSSDTCVYGGSSGPCSKTPIPVTGLTGITAIASGGEFNLALRNDGSVWAWGDNSSGQLGASSANTCGQAPSTRPCSLTPLLVSGLTGVTAIGAGYDHSLAVKSDGTLWSWGYNCCGEVGNGTVSPTGCFCIATPVQVVGPGGTGVLTGVVAAAGSTYSSAAVKSDGTVWAWGDNYYGELGIGTTTRIDCSCRSAPVQVVGSGGTGMLSGITAISGGGNYFTALKSDHTAWSWGQDGGGQLGDGTYGDTTCSCRPAPVQVVGQGGAGTLTSVTMVAAGTDDAHSLAVTGPSLVVAAPPVGTDANPPLVKRATSSDPVITSTGSYAYSHTDIAIAGRGPSPLFARSYNSNDTRVGAMGPGWTHNYAIRLNDPGDRTGSVILVGPQGRSDRYTSTGGGNDTAPPAIYTTLVHNGDGTYTATLQDQTTWRFDGTGSLIAIADRYGNQSNLTYNGSNQLITVSDPAGRGNLTLAYDPTSGLLTSVTDWASPVRSVAFGYDTSGRLQTVTDRTGKVTTYGYDGTSGRLTTITDANGHVAVTMTYDAQGRVSTQKDARGLTTGQQTTFSYATNADGTATTTVTYPVTSFEASWAPTVADTYDSQGRVTARVSRPTSTDTYTEQYGYDANFNRTPVTDARGKTSLFCYDVDATGATISTSHGNLTRTISPPPATGQNPLVSLLTYDSKNNLTQTVSPKGVANGATVTCTTNLSTSINTLYATDLAYDASQTLLLSATRRWTDPALGQQTAVTKYEYGDAANPGMVTRVIPPRGNTGSTPDYTYATTLAYTTAGLVQRTTDAMGNVTTFGYDAVGRRTSMVDPNGNVTGGTPAAHTWTYAYDNEDRLLTATAPAPVAGGAALTTQAQYDAVGNRTVVFDAMGQVTKYLYDERDSLQEVDESAAVWTNPATPPAGMTRTTYAYDHLGNLTRVLRAAGDAGNERATDYTYDGMNWVRQEIQYPNWPTTTPTLVTSTTYDGNSNRLTAVSPLNQTTTFDYDALNRLTSVAYSDGTTPNVTYSYDGHGNRLSMADGTGTTGYTYDEQDRLLAVTSPGTPGAKTVGYRYDLDGNRTRLVYPDATALMYAYDPAGRLTSATDWSNRVTSYQYGPSHQLQSVTNVDGSVSTLTRDNAQRLTQVWNSLGSNTISQHRYTLDAVGNRMQVDEVLPVLGAPGPGGQLTSVQGATLTGTGEEAWSAVQGATLTAAGVAPGSVAMRGAITGRAVGPRRGEHTSSPGQDLASWSALARSPELAAGLPASPEMAAPSVAPSAPTSTTSPTATATATGTPMTTPASTSTAAATATTTTTVVTAPATTTATAATGANPTTTTLSVATVTATSTPTRTATATAAPSVAPLATATATATSAAGGSVITDPSGRPGYDLFDLDLGFAVTSPPTAGRVILTLAPSSLQYRGDGAGGVLADSRAGVLQYHVFAPVGIDVRGTRITGQLTVTGTRATIAFRPGDLAGMLYPLNVQSVVTPASSAGPNGATGPALASSALAPAQLAPAQLAATPPLAWG